MSSAVSSDTQATLKLNYIVLYRQTNTMIVTDSKNIGRYTKYRDFNQTFMKFLYTSY